MTPLTANLSGLTLAERLARLQPALADHSRPTQPARAGAPASGGDGASGLTATAQANLEAALIPIQDPAEAAALTAQLSRQFATPGGTALQAQTPTASSQILALLAQG